MYRISIVVLVMLLGGCQLQRSIDRDLVAINTGYYQLDDAWSKPAQQLLQQVIWSDTEHNKHEFMVSVLLQPDQTMLLAISPLGQELWRIQYQTGHQLTVSGIAPFNQPNFAKLLLTQMQLAMYDLPHLQSRLTGINIKQVQNKRLIYDTKDQIIIEIDQAEHIGPGQSMQIKTADYQLYITTLQQDFLP